MHESAIIQSDKMIDTSVGEFSSNISKKVNLSFSLGRIGVYSLRPNNTIAQINVQVGKLS